MIIQQQNYQGKVFACKITAVGAPNDKVRLAHVLFDGDKAILLSNIMTNDGETTMRISNPFGTIDTEKLNVEILEEATPNVRTFDNVNSMVRIGVNDKYVIIDAETGKAYAYDVMKPPKGTPVHKGHLETKHGRKEIHTYPNEDLMRVTDCTTGTWVDVNPADISAYFRG